ncbi:hypothetical protein FVO59_04585 [Microbacterium esteraromaticum]|uniref:Uncharacterized protein n=1 Tax=Microbacterium esteraromaticum TaxID=57043 RepID=A0A7D8AI45_9MICO|nr:hypothetical protein [Microbacterium esteraromaticum]QMU96565.1 hypothetical protein FVO59_04585 [Microbacterium esteraromaticum]
MSAVHRHDDPAPAEKKGSGPLGTPIEREVLRGSADGARLPRDLWEILNTMVERELQQPEPPTEESLYAASTISGPFRARRFRRRLEQLIRLDLAQRQGQWVRPTVAGIAAVRPLWSQVDGPVRTKLRSLMPDEG